MAEVMTNLAPNAADMRRHLEFLFGDARAYDDGLIEIAVDTIRGGWFARLFDLTDIDAAVAFASAENAKRQNIYVGAALRDPDSSLNERCSDVDFYAATAFHCDLDDEAAVFKAVEGTKHCKPQFAVCTGLVPGRRMQLWWKAVEPLQDAETYRNILGGLADSLNGDRRVTNPGRVMRLAGSIAWPTKPGRVPEMTFIATIKSPDPTPRTADEMLRHYPVLDKVHALEPGKNDPIERVRKSGAFGFDDGVIDDGRHAYMRDTILAVLGEIVGTTGAAPTAQELNDAAWPQYSAHVDLTRPGRGPDVFARMCLSTVRRFERGQLRGRHGRVLTLDGLAADYKAKVDALAAKALQSVGITPPSPKPEAAAETPAPATAQPIGQPDALVLNKVGNPVWCAANALFTLRNHADWRDVLAFNEFTGRSVLLKAIPGTTPIGAAYPRDVRDGDYTAATVWFNRTGFPSASKQVVADALEMAAQDAIIHPVRNYLNNVKWDGKPRVRTWLQVYCAAEVRSEALATYIQEAGFRWMISAVARIFDPGCKADAALILEGRQGCGKSRGLKALAGEDFFGDSLPAMTSKDASTYLRGLWIIELAELSNINKAEVEHIKAFITRTEERFRPPYGRNEIAFPRQCVFAGTTNRDDYLRDDTGNRRFWPVTVGDVDVDALAEDRDLLWAEAVHHYRAGEQWHMSVEALELAQSEQSDRQADDPWTDAIGLFLSSRKSVTASMIAIECLGIDIGRVNRADQNRIISIVRQLGWKKAGRITAGNDYKGQSRYERAGK